MSKNMIATTSRLKSVLEAIQTSANEEGGFEAVGFEVAGDGPDAEAISQLAAIKEELDTEEDDDVLATRQDRMTSLLQTYLTENAPVTDAALAEGGFEATFDNYDLLGWTSTFFQWVKTWTPHKWIDPPPDAWEVPNTLRLAVLADWGTGLYGAPHCATSIQSDPKGFDIHLHLGDVYYSGTEKEVRERFLRFWPFTSKLGHLATNANHEMYSGGYGLFDVTLPEFSRKSSAFRQQSSCFAIQNDYFLMVGLDTAYEDHDMENGQVQWLRQLIQKAGTRRVILFSHHQPYSLLEDQGPKLVTRLADLLTSGRISAWYWGHEHRLVIYDQHPKWGIYGRCIGHGGMPYFRDKLPGASANATGLYRLAGKTSGGITVPSGRVLDGPNPYLGSKSHKYGPNGYLVLEFDKSNVREHFLQPNGQPVHEDGFNLA